jgi:alpha-mannosidase
VALLNDCKYGHDVRGNVMRLTLLRAPKTPGLSADVRKAHTFTYAILPHAGVSADGVARGAYELNVPALALRAKPHAGSAPPFLSRLSVTGEGVIIETVKKAEDDDGIIVRLYEARGARGRCTLRTTLPVRAAVETDLMERPERRLPVRNGAVALYFRPFQIRTLKLRCG